MFCKYVYTLCYESNMHSAGVVQLGQLGSGIMHAYGAHLLHYSSLVMATATLEEGVRYDLGLTGGDC